MDYLLTFSASSFLALLLVPLVKKLAYVIDIVDHPNPDNPGKIHKNSTPLLGGVAIYLAVIIILALHYPHIYLNNIRWALLIGGTTIMLIGILDDKLTLPYLPRLLFQLIIACTLVVVFKLRIGFISNVWISSFIAIFWMIGITNALNLMDNIDGGSSGISFIAFITLGTLAIFRGQYIPAIWAIAMAGACLGFLKYNFKPASIFLGDTGSLLLGFSLSAIALMLTKGLDCTFSNILLFPIILGVPIFDTTLATSLRIKNRRPFYQADKSNLTFRLLANGYEQIEVILIEYTMAIYFALCAFCLNMNKPSISYPLIFITILLLITLGIKLNYNPEIEDQAKIDSDAEFTQEINTKRELQKAA